jgi:hypothetical protein
MSEGFTKLFGSLIHSTIWREPDHVRLVWITMLAIVNRNGVVEASLPGLADAARVTVEQCEEALTKLSSPDKYSRSKVHEGRRILEIDGGWQLLNYESYRKRMSAEDQKEKTAERVRRARVKDREFESDVTGEALQTVTVTPGNECNDIAEAEAEADQIHPSGGTPREPSAKPKREPRRKPRSALPDDWKPDADHLERARGLGLNCRTEFEKFKNHALAGGRLMANWNAAFTTWLLNAQAFARPSGGARAAAPRQPDSGYRPSDHATEIT